MAELFKEKPVYDHEKQRERLTYTLCELTFLTVLQGREK